jgi:hypothetical protein
MEVKPSLQYLTDHVVIVRDASGAAGAGHLATAVSSRLGISIGGHGLVVAEGQRISYVRESGELTPTTLVETGEASIGSLALACVTPVHHIDSELDQLAPVVGLVDDVRYAIALGGLASMTNEGVVNAVGEEYSRYMDRFGSHPTLPAERRKPEFQILRAFWTVVAKLQGEFVAALLCEQHVALLPSPEYLVEVSMLTTKTGETVVIDRPMQDDILDLRDGAPTRVQPGQLIVLNEGRVDTYWPFK